MKLIFDEARCCGTGLCGAIASDHIEFRENGRPIIICDEVAPQDRADVEEAVQSCPTEALRLSESSGVA
jgi:ferredoxin